MINVFFKLKMHVPDMTNVPSGLKDASKVELLETGFTLYVDNWSKRQPQLKGYYRLTE